MSLKVMPKLIGKRQNDKNILNMSFANLNQPLGFSPNTSSRDQAWTECEASVSMAGSKEETSVTATTGSKAGRRTILNFLNKPERTPNASPQLLKLQFTGGINGSTIDIQPKQSKK